MADSARTIVRKVLSPRMADEIWSARYDKVLPISFNLFELAAVLPAVFYMLRFGHRRGKGQFLEAFGPTAGSPRDRRKATTIGRVAEELAASPDLHGFDGRVEQAILGDLLLGFSLENINHSLGRDKQIQRVAPAHYMASWVDLPESVTHLRSVPEMIVAMLANQDGLHVEPSKEGKPTLFPIAGEHTKNLLLRAFSHGVQRSNLKGNLAGDEFKESFVDLGIDQLLMIRLAQKLGAAPDKMRGSDSAKISNQRPIAENAASTFSEDMRRFVRAYAAVIPRHAFVDMLEACIATGMTTILTSVIEILFEWADTGSVIEKRFQRPASMFVDCSNGIDGRLRGLAEQSFDDLMRRVERVPAILMMLRLLDYEARYNRELKEELKKDPSPIRPYATSWLNLLGELLHKRHPEAGNIHRQMYKYGAELAEELKDDYPEAERVLDNEQNEPHPVRRLAAALTPLLGTKARGNTISMVDSTLNVERPNGLARKRKTTSGAHTTGRGRRQREVRSLVLTDPVLDYLVHLHLLRSGYKPNVKPLSLKEFLDRIRERYGFHVDSAPPGMTISNDLLRSNRVVLERRLRDLGLLVGVNDAEAMKRLRPRFEPRMDD